jgi:hypothetical protein
MIFNVFKILHRFGSRTYGVGAHFPFYSPMISSTPARYDAFFQDFIEYGHMKHPSFLRGEKKRNEVICGG